MRRGDTPDGREEKQRRWLRPWLLLLVTAYLGMAAYQAFKPLPEGLSVASPLLPASDVAFLSDVTYLDAEGNRQTEQAIFDEMLSLIDQAKRLVVLDMFLFNDFAGESQGDYRPLSAQLARALIERKAQMPGLEAVIITDPLNTLYGGLTLEHFTALRAAGVKLITTDLTELRASNPAWSGLWSWCCQWLGNTAQDGWLDNPLGPGQVTLRSYLAMLNFKANHRKTLVADMDEGWVGMVTSANPHDASSLHGNVALRFQGPAVAALLESERAVAHLSGADIDFDPLQLSESVVPGGPRLQLLTEGRIGDALIIAVQSAEPGDRIDIATFYLAHRELIDALKDAQARGVQVRVLLDPNKDAFGFEKSGIPNRPVAAELREANIPVRWCATHGEQCHAKILLKRSLSGDAMLYLGSANFTRRNLDDLNLETTVRLVASKETPAIADAMRWFDRYWHNPQGQRLSVPYGTYADASPWRYWQYRLMEATGLSTF
ncbi:phospholipase D family protein [Halomonas sp. McH1-25]|uniref:phospholipase D family protein n=1 Tax=unclassified Halomonas TaxID=2609666 RepID=UPI001EF74E24|nr:phospholipase D family protein [Halomonas sp. McH1-25]MCP1340732.1 phospholipase D family protein [Halomonas sp. FL8]MCP1359503.1 phospholipase D family protein [Halomonas sp. BBD45]